MGIFSRDEDNKVPRIDFELTQACNQHCAHCYNIWNTGAYPGGQLPTEQYLQVMERAIGESGASHVTLTGGEPLLREGSLQLIARACELAESVQLITNGSLVTPEMARDLASAGLRSAQLTLLSARPDRHDRLKEAGSFAQTTRAVLDLREAGVQVQICFVATRSTSEDLAEVLELCLALGIGALAYNRMSPAGGAIEQMEQLLPTVQQVEANLDTADRLGRRWGIFVSTAMPIPPCLVRLDRYSWIKFGFCSTGSRSPNLVVDPLGNLRSCNLSSHIMGNLIEQSWSAVMRDPYPRRFRKRLPALCRGCTHARSCQGGCKESARATFGSLEHPEPFLFQATASRP